MSKKRVRSFEPETLVSPVSSEIKLEDYRPDENIFMQGHRSRALYYVVKGKVSSRCGRIKERARSSQFLVRANSSAWDAWPMRIFTRRRPLPSRLAPSLRSKNKRCQDCCNRGLSFQSYS